MTEPVSNETLEVRLTALDRHVSSEFASLRELLKSQREGDQLALKTALANQKELADKHNDLIRQGERKDALYATRVDVERLERWQSRLSGGLLILAFIGIANLVKLWT